MALWLFHSCTAAEVDADALVVDHHVVAAVVAVAGGRLALAIKYFTADVLDVDDTLEGLQVVAAVMSGEEETDVVLLHVALYPLGCVHLGGEVGEHEEVGRAEGVAAEAVVVCLVEERGASGSGPCLRGSGNSAHLY